MADSKTLEERVTALEEKVGSPEAEWQSIPELIDARLRWSDARVARLGSEIKTLAAGNDRLGQRMGSLEAKVDALPRVLAEMLEARETEHKE